MRSIREILSLFGKSRPYNKCEFFVCFIFVCFLCFVFFWGGAEHWEISKQTLRCKVKPRTTLSKLTPESCLYLCTNRQWPFDSVLVVLSRKRLLWTHGQLIACFPMRRFRQLSKGTKVLVPAFHFQGNGDLDWSCEASVRFDESMLNIINNILFRYL